MTDSREFNIIVYGATGFVGELIVQHLAATAPEDARIALAGRSRNRVDALKARLGGRALSFPTIQADSAQPDTLTALAERTRVVLTTVGPYAEHGIPLVQACAEAGTHYADLTGEVLFVRESIDRFDELARNNGARIVHSCGFDSVPSDLATLLAADRARADGAGELTDSTLHASMRGGFSGGTIASMKGQVDTLHRDPAARKIVMDPYALSPDRAAEPDGGKSRFESPKVELDREIDCWVAPFVMSSFNEPIVRRSNALDGWAYGRSLRYREVMVTGKGRKGQALAYAVAAALGAVLTGLSKAPTRLLLDRILPKPGEGPSEKDRAAGRFMMSLRAHTTSGTVYVSRVGARKDPGYDGTAVMIGQAALALAFDADRLPQRAGVLTPATGIGHALADRLAAQGFTVDVAPATS